MLCDEQANSLYAESKDYYSKHSMSRGSTCNSNSSLHALQPYQQAMQLITVSVTNKFRNNKHQLLVSDFSDATRNQEIC